MATVPVTRTWVAGEVVTAAHFNTNIRDVLNFLLAKPIVELRQSSTQSIATGTEVPVTFNVEDVDSAGGHSLVSQTSRYTYVYPGWMVWGGAVGYPTNSTNRRFAWWLKNGSALTASELSITGSGAGNMTVAARQKRIFGNVGDYVELAAFQDSGSSLSTQVSTTAQSSMTGGWDSN